MAEIGKAYVQIVPSAKGIKSSVEGILNKDLPPAGDSGGSTLGKSIIGKMKAVISAAAIGKFIGSAVTEGGKLQQSLGGVETLFKNSANTVKQNAMVAFKTAGLSANDYMENVTSFSASLISSLGGNTKEAANLANMAMIDMSDNANKMGTDMDSIQQTYQSLARGNYAMLDNLKLGYGGTKSEMERLMKDAEKLTGEHYTVGDFADTVKAIHAVQKSMGITGTTAKEAATTLEGSFNMLKGSWQNFLGALSGESPIPLDQAIDDLIKSAETFVSNAAPLILHTLQNIGRTALTAFNKLPAGVKIAVAAVTTAVVAFKALKAAAAIHSVITQGIGAFQALWGVLAANPIIAIIAAIAAVVAALVVFFTKTKTGRQLWANFVNFLKTVWNGLVQIATTVWNAIVQAFTTAVQTVQNVWNGITSFFSNLWNGIVSGVSAAWNGVVSVFTTVVQAVQNVWNGITSFFSGLWNGIVSGISSAWNGVSQFFTNLWNGIVQVATTYWNNFLVMFAPIISAFENLWNALVEFFTTLWTGIQTVAITAWTLISTTLTTIWNTIVTVATTIWNVLVTVFSTIWNTIQTVAMTTWTIIQTVLTTIWNTIVMVATTIWNGLVAVFTVVWNTIQTVAMTVWTVIQTVLTTIWNTIVMVATSIWNNLVTVFTVVWNTIQTVTTTVWNVIKTVITTAINVVKGIIQTTLTAIQTIWNAIWNSIKALAMMVWNEIKAIVTTAINVVASVIRAITAAIKGNWSAVWNEIKNIATTIWNGIKAVATSIFNGIKAVVTTVWNAIKSITSTIWNGIKSTISGAMNGAKSAVSSAVDGIKSVLRSIGNVAHEAGKWASDLIDNFVGGIRRGIDAVGKAAGDVAGAVRKFLHFSEPDVGPLSDFHTYAPDMMAGFATGIRKNIPLVKSAVNELASMTSGALTIQTQPQPYVPGSNGFNSGNSSFSSQTTINVYGAKGQDVDELADVVIGKIDRDYKRKKAAIA